MSTQDEMYITELEAKLADYRKLVDTMDKLALFHTPTGWPELQDWIEKHSPEERTHLYTAAGMAWNLACERNYQLQLDIDPPTPEEST